MLTWRRVFSWPTLKLFSFALLTVGGIAFLYMREGVPSALAVGLTTILYANTINFSLPLTFGTIGLSSIVTAMMLLGPGPVPALIGVVLGSAAADVLRPLWRDLWRHTPMAMKGRREHLVIAARHVVVTAVAAALLSQLDAVLAQSPAIAPPAAFSRPLLLFIGFFLLEQLLTAAMWLAAGFGSLTFWREAAVPLLVLLALSLAAALLLAYVPITVPTFVALAVTLGVLAINAWIAWQRRYVLERRLEQLARLNALSAAIRETLDPMDVFRHLHTSIAASVSVDTYYVALRNEAGKWTQPLHVTGHGQARTLRLDLNTPYEPNDLTRWVVAQRRLLRLDAATYGYAARHQIRLPDPRPASWTGVPLMIAERAIGVLVLEQQAVATLSRWDVELLVAIAGQASAAIENARLHSETVRLFNLTDEALARRVEQLQALVNSVEDGILMLDWAGRVALVNPPAVELIGRPDDALFGHPLDPNTVAARLGFTPKALAARIAALKSAAARPPDRHVYALADSIQRRFYERTEAAVRAQDGGQLMGWLMVFRDVTERQARDEWRSDLTRMIVHDLRNPITTLVTSLDLIEGHLPQPAAAGLAELLGASRYGLSSLLEMVDTMLDINRAEAGALFIDPEAVDLVDVAGAAVAAVRPVADKRGVAVSLEAARVPEAWGDAEYVRRILINLLDNALKFTPAGGSVRVTLRPHPLADRAQPGVCVAVADSGPGIPPEQRERIFDRFVTYDRGGASIRGTGIGLTFCRLAVAAHGGEIWVEDGAGGGSVFNFTLPGVPF